MSPNRAATLAIAFAIATATACNCGYLGSGAPCTDTVQCPASEYCVEGSCRFSEEPPDGGQYNPGPDGGDGGSNGGGSDGGDGGSGCVGLECQQTSCPTGSTTRITGTVLDPAGLNPVYNALVYVPNGTVQPFTDGVVCEVCNPATGNPLVLTTTGVDGTFKLDNMPVGTNIPLVVQVGKWRRQTSVPTVTACQSTAVASASIRLPRNKSEGDLPKIAISTGNVDPFECLLLRMGVDSAEFTGPSGNGRIHWYRRNGMDLTGSGTHASLVDNLDTLKLYDVVILPCTGNNPANPDLNPGNDSTAQRAIINYTSSGGRIFATHFSYEYVGTYGIPTSATTMTPVATWGYDSATPTINGASSGFNSYFLDQSFPKGRAFYGWLAGQGALDGGTQVAQDGGTMWIQEPRHDVDAVNPAHAQQWMFGNNPQDNDRAHVEHFTFNTPVDAGTPPLQCGRVVFSDFHVSTNAIDTGSPNFPARCQPGVLNPQEKALEFMLFDLSACVQADKPACGNTSGATCSPLEPCCAGSGLSCIDGQGLACQSPSGCSCQQILQ